MVSYPKLTPEQKRSVEGRLEIRRIKHNHVILNEKASTSRDILIVGDKPGPSAPKDPGYHHTPFYSTKHCSGWLNALLEVEGIPEDRLIWINSADKDGVPTFFPIVELLIKPATIICLGGNAEKWIKNACGYHRYVKVDHPQYHKRFKNKEPYPLIQWIKEMIKVIDNDA